MTRIVIDEDEIRTRRLDVAADDDLRVHGVISVDDEDETIRFEFPTDGATIVNYGVIENTADEGRAIVIKEEVGDTFNAVFDNRGEISSEDDAIKIDTGDLVSGKLLIKNGADGLIHSDIGQALDLADATGDFLSVVQNKGEITSGENDGVKIGGVGRVINSGHISGGDDDGYSDGADGVSFEDGAKGVVRNTGLIEGDRHGVDAGEDSVVRVVNELGGVIMGHNGSGVGSDGSGTVVNYGKIVGSFSDSEGSDIHGTDVGEEDGGGPDGVNDGDGDGVDIDFEAHIFNYGVIKGVGSGGTGSDGLPNTSEGIAAGGGEIYNYEGARITGVDVGILIDDSSQGGAGVATLIDNQGLIKGGDGLAIRIIGDQDDTIVNDGQIIGKGGVAIDFGGGDDTLVVKDDSEITGLTRGGEGDDTLDYSEFSEGARVNLTTGKATGTGGVEGFETVIGSDHDDRLVGDSNTNLLIGGDGDDFLASKGGNDTLIGGDGDDTFHIGSDGGAVVIQDFAQGADKISLGKVFGLSNGELASSAFANGTEAQDAFDRIIYDAKTGNLFFDADGAGGADAIKIATLSAGLDLGADDFLIS